MEKDCGGAVTAIVELFVYGFFQFGREAFDYFSIGKEGDTAVRFPFRVSPSLFRLLFL